MKKLVLINPPLTLRERYGKLSFAGIRMPPHGLGYLTSYLRAHGYEVTIVDCEALELSFQAAVEEVLKHRPDYIGITATTVAIHSAAELARRLRSSGLRAPIIIGGVHVSALPEETMLAFPQFDIGVIGEGEETLLELVSALENGSDLERVRGLICRRGENTVLTPGREFIENIDLLPFPAWDAYPALTRYYQPAAFSFRQLPTISLITSRGCPYRCSFCSRSVWGRTQYREHSAEYVFRMIKHVHTTYGIRDITIYDDTFGLRKQRVVDLCEMLINADLNISWLCNLRVNMIDPDLLRLMKRAGCWQIGFGIESGSQRILDFLHKDITTGMIEDAVTVIKNAGLTTRGSVMVGVVSETRESLDETARFIATLPVDFLTVNIFTPMPGSDDYSRAEHYGRFNKDWRLLNQYTYVFVPHGLTRKDLEDYVKKITRSVFLRFRPGMWLRFLGMCTDPRKLKIIFKGFVSFLKYAS